MALIFRRFDETSRQHRPALGDRTAAGLSLAFVGTYRQWQERGCQVRKHEKSSLIVFRKQLAYEQADEQSG